MESTFYSRVELDGVDVVLCKIESYDQIKLLYSSFLLFCAMLIVSVRQN